MKKNLLTLVFLLACAYSYAQTLAPTPSINAAGSVNTFTGGYTFAYATSGSPWNGALISFGGLLNRYDCQLSTDYQPGGGKHISFRTHNGDAPNIWNPWYEIYHTGNLNNTSTDFTARTLNSTSIYNSGNLWSKQVTVALTNPWADYVFKKDYRLPSLAEVKTYIDQHQHLPEIPSEKEIAKDGINLGEMNKLLLKKVEELTLYLIEQQQTNKKLQQQIDDLKIKVTQSNNQK